LPVPKQRGTNITFTFWSAYCLCNFSKFGNSATQGPHYVAQKLMIPFVENAFKHGVGLVASPVIDISATTSAHQLLFTVRNKITPEAASERDNSSGIGLQNVRRRLELLYPEARHLEVR